MRIRCKMPMALLLSHVLYTGARMASSSQPDIGGFGARGEGGEPLPGTAARNCQRKTLPSVNGCAFRHSAYRNMHQGPRKA